MKVRVLYEDQLAPNGDVANYAPHTLVLKCLYDQSQIQKNFSQDNLKRLVVAYPCKGNSKLIKHFEEKKSAFLNAQIAPVCCLDGDWIHKVYGLSKPVCKTEIKAKHWQNHGFGYKTLVIIERNLEDVLRKAQEIGAKFTDTEMDAACRRKNLDARDALILRVANNPELRAKLVTSMDTFNYLVDKVARLALLP